MNWIHVYTAVSHHAIAWPQNSQRFFVLDDARQPDLYIPAGSTLDTWTHTAENEPRPKTRDQWNYQKHIQRFFLKAACFSGSALAINGRGFLKRKPSCRNKRWH